MNKEDLKEGMRVKLRGYEEPAIVKNSQLIYDKGAHIGLKRYDDDLRLLSENNEYTIEAVYSNPKLIWENIEEYREITMEEIESALGYKIKIVCLNS